ncbi:hypothetical protein [Nitratireductor soli]|uniref:hypothetical protein n=1 Tax=Nitratireductor soli TaxID=1670619 RepID=UPI00065E2B10|nr:hypothetical protein [Nitratireductor soli]
MEHDPRIHALLRRRSEIAGEVLHLDSQVEKLRADLKHLDAALKVMGYINEDALPVRKSCTSGLFHRKELGRLVVGHLRDNPDGLQARDIALLISRDKGWESDDNRFQKALKDKVSRALSKLKASDRADYENAQSGCIWRLL